MENNSTEQGDLLKAYCLFPSHNNGKLKSWSCLTAQPKRASCDKSIDILQLISYIQADIRMRLHAFHVPAASYQQTSYKLVVKAC